MTRSSSLRAATPRTLALLLLLCGLSQQVCDLNCRNCSTDTGLCTQCGGALLLQGSACLHSCYPGFFAKNSTCTTCEEPCSTCQSEATQCLTCSDRSQIAFNFSCVPECPPGYYSVGTADRQCTLCPPGCVQCLQQNFQVFCEKCADGLLIVSGQCYSTCPPSFRFNQQSQTCLFEQAVTTCDAGFIEDLAGYCAFSCPAQSYLDASLRKCFPCVTIKLLPNSAVSNDTQAESASEWWLEWADPI